MSGNGNGHAPAAPPTPVAPVDPGNGLLGETPAQLVTTQVQTAAGPRLAMTIRTPSTTLTVLLGREDARRWGDQIKVGADQMGGLIVPQAGVA